MKKGSGMRQLLVVLLAVWMAAAGALGVAAQEEKKQVAMSFTARSALLMEQQTGKVLFSQNETQRMAPASLTKLMDLLLIFQQLQSGKLTMEQELTCSAYAKTMGGSEIWLKEGERMTVEELLKALVVASANDAAVVFAEAIASSEEEFVRLMNEKAQQLGLQNTHFVNCTGFDEEGHYTCAQDAAVLYKLNPADCLTLCHRCLKLFAKLQLYFDAIRLIFLYHRLWQHLDLRLHLRLHPLLDRYRMQPVLRQLRLV